MEEIATIVGGFGIAAFFTAIIISTLYLLVLSLIERVIKDVTDRLAKKFAEMEKNEYNN